MDSLYGDLPPPVSSNRNRVEKGDHKNSSGETKNSYIEINKFLITPAIIQKKIANIRNVSRETDGGKDAEKDERDVENKGIGADNGERDVVNRGIGAENDERDEANGENGVNRGGKIPTGSENKLASKDKQHNRDEHSSNETKMEIININKSIQDDLKKISDRLNKIQQGSKSEHILGNFRNNQEKEQKYKGIEIKLKGSQTHDSNCKGTNSSNVMNKSCEYYKNELYDKYFIADANEDYDPNKPNDLNKIIKERKRKKLIMLAAHKKKLEEQIEETKDIDSKIRPKDYERKNTFTYHAYDENRKDSTRNVSPWHEDGDRTRNGEREQGEGRRTTGKTFGPFGPFGPFDGTLSGEYPTDEGNIESRDQSKDKVKSKNVYSFYDNNATINATDDNINEYTKKSKEMLPQNANERENDQVPVKKDFATRMMEKMGWKKGEGLGRDKQGIKAPLILQKVDKRSGVIVQAPVILKKNEFNNDNNSYDNKHISANAQHSNPSRIIQLTNLVTIEEVDDTLKEEIEEEASKFGNLLNIDIVTDTNMTEALAVKIFCEYESCDQAQNALNTFKGRTFAGRKVEAMFANEQEYHSQAKKD
ncbi:RNA-binding protein, putative [Plasmodium ovale wallikeri]|uniref:RNA-binding protein, putative n=1 Tax=Plasmodium ovale wallikeri TaxID=864142 RepID=A0A1A8ZG01_PLAOA|nr:RNA-binding protein, putative [Plasmodium ovale wallikeri]